MASINVDGVFGAASSELTLDVSQITVSKRFHTIAAASGTVGTIQSVALDSGIGTQLNGSLSDVYIRPAAGHFIAVQHAIPGTDPVYNIGSQTVHLNDTKTLHLVRNFGSNSWLGVNGIQLSGAPLADTTSLQTLSNKELAAPKLMTPEITGSFVHNGLSGGYTGSPNTYAQVGTTIVGAVTGTIASISLSEIKSMKIKASVLAAPTDHSESLYSEVTGLFRRVSAGNIIMVGTTTPVTIGTSALALSLGIDTSAQAANILVTGIAGTANFVVDYTYNQLGQA